MNRRSFLAGLGSLIAAPAIVRASSLMPVRGIVMPVSPGVWVKTDVWGAWGGGDFRLLAETNSQDSRLIDGLVTKYLYRCSDIIVERRLHHYDGAESLTVTRYVSVLETVPSPSASPLGGLCIQQVEEL